MDRHIFLIGIPGSGKSSLGRKAAATLQLNYLDTDHYLTNVTGMDTAQLYATYGEQAFRDAETRILQMLVTAPPGVISTGGGLPLREVNRQLMKNHGVIVLIDRPADCIAMNIRAEKRPFLAEQGLEGVERIYEERIPLYRSIADYVMENGNHYATGLNSLINIMRGLV